MVGPETARGPVWWTDDFPEILTKREFMPGCERLQTTYVRYRGKGAIVAPQGWELNACRRNCTQLIQNQDLFVPEDHPIYTDFVPVSVDIKLLEAPAEFAMPVKQDRRLSPNFKVKVDVKHIVPFEPMAITVKLHVIGQQDKDNILNWEPGSENCQPPPTELRGSTQVVRNFKSATLPFVAMPRIKPEPHSGPLPGLDRMPRQSTGISSTGNGNALAGRGYPGAGADGMMPLEFAGGNMGMMGFGGMSGMAGAGNGVYMDPTAAMYPGALLNGGQTVEDIIQSLNEGPFPNTPYIQQQQARMQQALLQQQAHLGFDGYGMQLDQQTTMLMQQQAAADSNSLQLALQQQQLQAQLQAQARSMQQRMSQGQTMSARSSQAQQQQAFNGSGNAATSLVHGGSGSDGGMDSDVLIQEQSAALGSGDLQVVSQEYEFAGVEFLKPTRMNRVYLVFSCTVLDIDTLFVVYEVPTIGICRAEQRDKACMRLGMTPQQVECLGHAKDAKGGTGNSGQVVPKTEPVEGTAGARKRDGSDDDTDLVQGARAFGGASLGNDGNDGFGANIRISSGSGGMSDLALAFITSTGTVPTGADGRLGDLTMCGARSRQAMHEWISEEYEITGLTRRLTLLDMQALLSHAGFPIDASSEHTTISDGQWAEFTAQFKQTLGLLRQIAGVWNLQDPCIISGFDMDRKAAEAALAKEPTGTFICRVSLSRPDMLVLTCKTGPGHVHADEQGLIHATVSVSELYERRVDTWIRDFAGATHVLDVYSQKRVDKRKVFTSNYTRLKDVPPAAAGDNGLLDALNY